MEENENLKQAVEKLDEISADEKMQRIAELRQKAIMDEQAIYSKGIKEGIKEGKIETADKLLKENIPIEVIMRATGLTEEEIKKMKK